MLEHHGDETWEINSTESQCNWLLTCCNWYTCKHSYIKQLESTGKHMIQFRVGFTQHTYPPNTVTGHAEGNRMQMLASGRLISQSTSIESDWYLIRSLVKGNTLTHLVNINLLSVVHWCYLTGFWMMSAKFRQLPLAAILGGQCAN